MAGASVDGINVKDMAVVEKFQENLLSPPPQQNKKRMRQPSTPRAEDVSEAVVEENVTEKSTSVMMLEILETVQGNQAHLRTIEQSLAFVHSELDAQKAETNQLKSENEELKARLDRVEKRCDVLEEDLRIQSKMRDENEQNSRMVNLEISGVPQLQGETDTDC